MFEDYVHYDGLGLAELIAKGEVTPREVLEAAILRAEKLNPELNAIVTPLYDYAQARAKQPLSGPFAGVPFLLKDAHHALRGTPMSNGSRLHKGEVSAFDAEIVRRFLAAGVVVFGKTNTPEYKLSAHTISEAWGARAGDRPPRWRAASCRWRRPPMRAGRSACRPPRAVSSA